MHKVTPFHLAIPTTVRAACLQTWLTSLNNADFSKNLSIFDVAGPQKYNKLKKRGNFVQAVMRSRNIKSLTTLSHTKKEPLDHWVSSENLNSAKSAKFCRKLSVFAQTEFIGLTNRLFFENSVFHQTCFIWSKMSSTPLY